MTAVVVRPRSPLTVFAACFLLAGVAAASVTATIATFYSLPQMSRHYSDAQGDGRAGAAAGLVLILLALFSLVVGGVYLLLAFLNSKGLQGARIVTWIVTGLTVIVTAITLIAGGFGPVPWYRGLSTALTAVALAFAAAVAVLLALPAAQGFYRAARQARLAARPVRPPRYPPYPPHQAPPYGQINRP